MSQAVSLRSRLPQGPPLHRLTIIAGSATIGVLATSTLYQSVPRSLLLLWPVWCGLAVAAARRAWVGQLYLAVSVPVAAMIGLLFMNNYWAG